MAGRFAQSGRNRRRLHGNIASGHRGADFWHVDRRQFFPQDFEKKALAAAKTQLGEFIARNVPGDIKAKGHVAHGVIYEEILHTAAKLDCDLIVLASQRPELRDYLIGPNAARVVRHATQSVLVVRS